MSAAAAHPTPAPARTLCLGEALVDFVGEQPGRPLTEVERFSAHFGGVTANVAVFAARLGARVSLAGGAGDDIWGRWLLERLRSEWVDVSLFELTEGTQTPLVLVSLDRDGRPSYELRGDGVGMVARTLAERVDEAVADCAGLFFTTNTLAGDEDRAVTMRARQVALELGRPVIFDANLRLHRWSSRADAVASANACVTGALLARVNLDEAEVMTGESEPERAAAALLEAGARMVVLTLGTNGVLLRGALRATVPGVAPEAVLNTAGAGDALTGTLLARLALSDFHPAAVAAALPEAVRAGAQACARWGAID